MFEWITEVLARASANIVFFSIFLGGLTFSVFSIFFGGHEDVDHDLGDGDVGSDTDGDGDHGETSGEGQGISIAVFSIRGISLLAVGFGGVGLIAHLYTGKLVFSTLVALVVGYGFATIMLYIVRMLKSQQSNSIINMGEAVGAIGMITTSIPEGGMGEVRFVVSGVEMTKMCFSANRQPIKSGTQVHIESANGGTVVVSAIQ